MPHINSPVNAETVAALIDIKLGQKLQACCVDVEGDCISVIRQLSADLKPFTPEGYALSMRYDIFENCLYLFPFVLLDGQEIL